MFFERVAVIGVGLIGGSFSLALKEKNLCGHVVGVGRSAANMKVAMDRGVVDSVAELTPAVVSADLVYVATPGAQFAAVMQAVGRSLKPGALAMDAGSTKRDVVVAARQGLGARIAQFIPAHPIAGAEKSGAEAASAALFRGRRLVLTPLAENRENDVEAMAALWREIGARVSRMTPDEHDQVFSVVSHLPHLLAYALVHDVSSRPDSAQLFGYAAGGFRDFTRIASSHPEMWRDICVANSDQLLKDLSRFSAQLEKIRAFLEHKDAGSLEKLFTEARAARGRWLNGEYE